MLLNEHTTEMMAETVTVHFIDKNNWSSYDAYVFDANTDKTISEKIILGLVCAKITLQQPSMVISGNMDY